MPSVAGKKFPYTAKGKADAAKARAGMEKGGGKCPRCGADHTLQQHMAMGLGQDKGKSRKKK